MNDDVVPYGRRTKRDGEISDKKEQITRFDVQYFDIDYQDNGSSYNVDDVHEAIKKSIDNESIEMIKADLSAYFGLEL